MKGKDERCWIVLNALALGHLSIFVDDHVFVFGEEENGVLTPYYPDDMEGSSILVGIGRGLMLPDSVQLDDSLGRECMVAVFSQTPLSWVDVQALRHNRLGAHDGMLMEQVCFEKQQ